MRTHIIAICLLFCSNAFAQVMICPQCGTEMTQIQNNIQLAMQYAQQVQQYVTQVQQYETMLKNLIKNPGAAIRANVNQLAANQAKLLTKGKDIGNSMQKIDDDFNANFGPNSPIKDFAQKLKDLSGYSQDALKTAMLNNGIHRESFQSDADALNSLVDAARLCDGQLCAIQALSDIAATQVTEGQKLRDLITLQNQAMSKVLVNKVEAERETVKMGERLKINEVEIQVPANAK